MSPQEQWSAVDDYFAQLLVQSDAVLEESLAASKAAGLPAIHVSPTQGKFLMLLAMISRAKRVLEIGTLGGYSTIWLARGLPADGKVVTLEFDPKHAAIARQNFARAGIEQKIDLRLGRALETLPLIEDEAGGPFDLIFIDADKISTCDYFQWSLKLSRSGTVIVIDNVVREGEIVNAQSSDGNVQALRRLNQMLSREPRVTSTAIQTVGGKGYDGFAMVVVK